MRTDRLRQGDVVEANVRGLIFRATVVDTDPRDWAPGYIEVRSLHQGYRGYRFLSARQVKAIVERAPRRTAA